MIATVSSTAATASQQQTVVLSGTLKFWLTKGYMAFQKYTQHKTSSGLLVATLHVCLHNWAA